MAEFEIVDGLFVDVKITDAQAERLERGESVTLSVFPDAEMRRYTIEDIGFSPDPPFTKDDYRQPRVVRRRADGHRVHIAPAGTGPLEFNHPNPSVDSKKLTDSIRNVIEHERKWTYKGTATDLNVGPEFDAVDRPSHYAEGREIEPIDVIDDWTLGFYEGQVLKYISRAGRKTDSELEDLRKAKFYLDRLVRLVAEDEE